MNTVVEKFTRTVVLGVVGVFKCSTTGGVKDFRQLRRARCGELDPMYPFKVDLAAAAEFCDCDRCGDGCVERLRSRGVLWIRRNVETV